MAQKKNRSFHITTPDVRTVYIGEKHRQKARYIQLHENFGEKIFLEDIEAGAKIYEPFREILKNDVTRYNIITAPTEEDGLRAVSYLAGIHAADLGYQDDIVDTSYDDNCNSIQGYSEEDELDIVDFDLDEYDPDIDHNEPGYYESPDRIPVIELRDVVAMEGKDRNNGMGFGMFNMQLQARASRTTPWWNDCREHSVCLILDDNVDGGNFTVFGGDFQILTGEDIACLKRFEKNEHVYVLVVSKNIEENDHSVTSAMLDYTANCFRTDCDNGNLMQYYQALLVDEAKKHGFSISKSVDLKLLTEKLSRIDRFHPCEKFGKIMDYLIHIKASKVLKAADFESLGLKKLIDTKAGDTQVKFENELVGMEQVKKQVMNIMNMLRYTRMRAARNIRNSGFHNVHLFIGAPGTAKTTVAKMMARQMQEEGLISGSRFISVTGAQLKGEYVGQTAPKVHSLFQSYDAIFIDEAYSLTCGDTSGMDIYSQEALAQLAVELEEHATDKLVIFAGYGGRVITKQNNLMKQFLEANPGISSRINSTIYFDSYTPDEMVNIVHCLAKNASLSLTGESDREIEAYFRTRQYKEDFGNGREARVFLEQCERSVAERVASLDPEKIEDSDLNNLTEEDVKQAILKLNEKYMNEQGQSGTRLGFM